MSECSMNAPGAVLRSGSSEMNVHAVCAMREGRDETRVRAAKRGGGHYQKRRVRGLLTVQLRIVVERGADADQDRVVECTHPILHILSVAWPQPCIYVV